MTELKKSLTSPLKLLFFIVFAADLTCVFMQCDTARYFAKPLILLSLMIYAWVSTSGVRGKETNFLMAALFFSWLGDILLMFESFKSIFFIFGLVAFLIAHIFYIFLFSGIKRSEQISTKWILIFIVALYYAALILFLCPQLGEMEWPVRIYGIVISLMLLVALHLYYSSKKEMAIQIITGAILFVISDSILAINKFHSAVPFAGIWIMLTYGLAQFFIVQGSIRWMHSQKTG